MRPDPKLIKALEDVISEEDVKKTLGCSTVVLARLRKKGKLTARTITGRNYVYSRTEIALLLNLQTQ